MPRTGSSHLNKLFRSCPEFDAKSELFHRHAVGRFTDRELVSIRAKAPGLSDENFTTWRREHPIELLEALLQAHARQITTFKVFPGHLPKQKLKSKFFTLDDIGFAILKRRPIECYISGVKAKLMEKFGALDTTALKPAISVAEFVPWATRTRFWYKWTRRELDARKIPYAAITFEEHLDGLSGAESLAKILPLLKPLGFPDIPVPPDIIEGKRQDKERDYQARVANWDEFVKAAQAEPQSKQLLKWALAVS